MEQQRLFTDTFRKYFDGWIADIFIPKLSRASLYRTAIFYIQLAADAAAILVYSFEINQTGKDEYEIVINGNMTIEISLVSEPVNS